MPRSFVQIRIHTPYIYALKTDLVASHAKPARFSKKTVQEYRVFVSSVMSMGWWTLTNNQWRATPLRGALRPRPSSFNS
jgi:hypothetical protein